MSASAPREVSTMLTLHPCMSLAVVVLNAWYQSASRMLQHGLICRQWQDVYELNE